MLVYVRMGGGGGGGGGLDTPALTLLSNCAKELAGHIGSAHLFKY